MKKPFSVTCKEQGRGKGSTQKFATLLEAQTYIKDRWQGADYMDGPSGFHTDYSTYILKGFTLKDIGRSWFDAEFQCREFAFTELGAINENDEAPAEASQAHSQAAAVCCESQAVVPF